MFFKSAPIQYESYVASQLMNEKESEDLKLQDSSLDHIIIEPDIEIQTLSDEFQMEFEESEARYKLFKFALDYMRLRTPNSSAPVTGQVTSIEQIEKAAKETLCCSSCSASLYNRTDSLLWESMEFCSDKCLSK